MVELLTGGNENKIEKVRVTDMEEMLYKGCIIRSACKEEIDQPGKWKVGLDIISTDSGYQEVQPIIIMVDGAPVYCDTEKEAIGKCFQLGQTIIDRE